MWADYGDVEAVVSGELDVPLSLYPIELKEEDALLILVGLPGVFVQLVEHVGE